MGQSLSYYITLLVIKLKGVKKDFSKDPIDFKKIRKEDIHYPKGRFFTQKKAHTFKIAETDHKHTRTYSLSDANNKDYLRISVKKEANNPDGIVSNYLHSHKAVGDTLSIGMPSGEFVLKESMAHFTKKKTKTGFVIYCKAVPGFTYVS